MMTSVIPKEHQVPDGPTWRELGLCWNWPGDSPWMSTDKHDNQLAASICRTGGEDGTPCPSINECLAYAENMGKGKAVGVWGGRVFDRGFRTRMEKGE